MSGRDCEEDASSVALLERETRRTSEKEQSLEQRDGSQYCHCEAPRLWDSLPSLFASKGFYSETWPFPRAEVTFMVGQQ